MYSRTEGNAAQYLGAMSPGEAAYERAQSAPKTSPAPPVYEVETIEVTGRAVPWYVWVVAGGALIFLLTSKR